MRQQYMQLKSNSFILPGHKQDNMVTHI